VSLPWLSSRPSRPAGSSRQRKGHENGSAPLPNGTCTSGQRTAPRTGSSIARAERIPAVPGLPARRQRQRGNPGLCATATSDQDEPRSCLSPRPPAAQPISGLVHCSGASGGHLWALSACLRANHRPGPPTLGISRRPRKIRPVRCRIPQKLCLFPVRPAHVITAPPLSSVTLLTVRLLTAGVEKRPQEALSFCRSAARRGPRPPGGRRVSIEGRSERCNSRHKRPDVDVGSSIPLASKCGDSCPCWDSRRLLRRRPAERPTTVDRPVPHHRRDLMVTINQRSC